MISLFSLEDTLILNFSLYKEVIKICSQKILMTSITTEVCQAGDQLCVLIFMGFLVFASLLNFLIYCDFLFRIRLCIKLHA